MKSERDLSPANRPRWPSRQFSTPAKGLNFVDYDGPRQSLEQASDDLFRRDGAVKLAACQINDQVKFKASPILNYKDLEVYLERHYNSSDTSPKYESQFFFLDRSYAEAPLNITDAALSLLLQRLNAFPKLSSLLTTFTGDEVLCHEGRGGFHVPLLQKHAASSSASELCMMLKYVEPSQNKADIFPWCIRQMVLYQRLDTVQKRESTLFVCASDSLRRRIREEVQESVEPAQCWSHWTNLHLIMISSLTQHWGELLKYLDIQVCKIDKISRLTDPFAERLGEVNFKDLQASQFYTDMLLRTSHVLQSNITVLHALSVEAQRRQQSEPSGNEDAYAAYATLDDMIESTIREIQFLIGHAELIKSRLANISAAIRDCIQVRTSHHASVESSHMRDISVRTIIEARTVRTIALMTLLFLPATFTTGFLDAGIITASFTSAGELVVGTSPGLYFWLALTLPLTFVTVGGWLVWEWTSRRRRKAREQNPTKDLKV